MKRGYRLCDPVGVETLKLAAVINKAFFISLRWVRPWTFFVHCLKNAEMILNVSKLFISHESIFLLKRQIAKS